MLQVPVVYSDLDQSTDVYVGGADWRSGKA